VRTPKIKLFYFTFIFVLFYFYFTFILLLLQLCGPLYSVAATMAPIVAANYLKK